MTTASSFDGPPLFSFVVVADTHVNERDGVSSSPYHTNALANERARHAFLDIAAMDPAPEFVIHLGDIVHPVPSLPTFDDAVACFKDIASLVDMPVHLVPGNHDVGDKRIDWMPADQVCDSFLSAYRAAFGPDYFSFDKGSMRFVMVNSLLINSGLDDEQQQKQWLEGLLESAAGKRVFLFMHYPPYIYSTGERGNYDNLDEPGRSWLLALMQRPEVEAAFAGHVHNFWYDRVGDAEFYMLPSTAFLRHDFTEFYKTAPDVEFGRGDSDKFGYFVVDVYANGHVVHSIRTLGARAVAGTQSITPATRYLAHPKTSDFDHVGVELRHPWTESMQITATGGVQEFGRKWARNDYPLLALLEMGARLCKVPDLDLLEPESRDRMKLLARVGQQYVVTTLGAPKPPLLANDLRACGVRAFEVNVTADQFQRQREALRELRKAHDVQVYYSKILTADPSHYDGTHFSHFVKAGFTVDELERYRTTIVDALQAGDIDGITVRVEPHENLIDVSRQLTDFHRDTGCLVLASLKLSGPSLSVERAEDRANVASVAQAMILSKTSEGVRYIYDTFMDVDRGYFPRHAFIDRHFNPRGMAKAFTILTSLLSGSGKIMLIEGERTTDASLEFKTSDGHYLLICNALSKVSGQLKELPSSTATRDLISGHQSTIKDHLKQRDITATLDNESMEVMLITL